FFLANTEGFTRTESENNLLIISTSFSTYTINALITIFVTLFTDFVMQFLCARNPKFWFQFLTTPSSFLLTLTLPLTLGFLKFTQIFFPKSLTVSSRQNFKVREKIVEWLQESEIESLLEKNEKKLIYSVISFKDRIAREIMVPRINVFSIPQDTTINQAAKFFLEEGYSRMPVYKEKVDKIIGVLLYKDVLNLLIMNKSNISILDTKTVEKMVKPVVYTPETKKISNLLQELKNKHLHLAIVVDEYGGTEGIVTIEDIIEELVGEIEDEYDIHQSQPYTSTSTGGWIVDAKMTIIDIEEELGISIPTSPEYDTIGGYIFDKAGTIPSSGWKIHLDDCEIEVLSSDERSIGKIKLHTQQRS
ncbi:MAG: HlyC/CorC family transporter, partial [Chlamydiae bacterium]|nr:HlyC/CorC family transporter [Chlamydiota bacterium]